MQLELTPKTLALLTEIISKSSAPSTVGAEAIRTFADLVEAIETTVRMSSMTNGLEEIVAAV